jgi:hypothetical protein
MTVKYVGNVAISTSLHTIPPEEHLPLGWACMKAVTSKAAEGDEEASSTDDKYADVIDGHPNVHNQCIDLNISHKSIIIIGDGMSLFKSFGIRDISLIVPGSRESELNEYFCFFVKETVKTKKVRRCFVFYAGSDMEEIYRTITIAFRLSEEKVGIDKIQFEEAPNSLGLLSIKRTSESTDILDEAQKAPPRPKRISCNSSSGNSFSSNRPEVQVDPGTPDTLALSSSEDDSVGTLTDKPITKASNGRPRRVSERSSSSSTCESRERFQEITTNLLTEPWFHGPISREVAESRVQKNGQFLVRQSPNLKGQLVLTGMHKGDIRHVCLVDSDGNVRTSDKEFKSVSELIRFYNETRRCVGDLLLTTGVLRPELRIEEPQFLKNETPRYSQTTRL